MSTGTITGTAAAAPASGESTLSLTFTTMVANIGQRLYGSRSPTGDDLAECKRIVNEGYAYFVGWHDWSFLHPTATITLWPTIQGTFAVSGATDLTVKDVTDGTMAVTNATTVKDAANKPFGAWMVGLTIVSTAASYVISRYVSTSEVIVSTDASADDGETFTITNTPFMASMVGKTIKGTNGSYTIATYVSSAEITVTTTAAADDNEHFSIAADGNYTLPDDFGEPEGLFNYGPNTGYGPLCWTGADVIRAKRAGSSSGYHPMLCSLQAMELAVLIGQRWELLVWPTPATETTLYYQYLRNPAAFSADADYPVGGMRYSRAVMQCAYAALETEQGRTEGPEAARAERMLTKVLGTNARQQPRILGSNRDNSDQIRQPTDPMIWQGGLDMT